MDKLKMETPDMVSENIQKIGELFPQVITEDKDIMRGGVDKKGH